MKIKNICPDSPHQSQHAFAQWKRTLVTLFGLLFVCLTIVHAHQIWSAYCCYQQSTQYNVTEREHNNMHTTLQHIAEQHATNEKQLKTMQTQCTPPINPAGIFALDTQMPDMTLHAARIAPELITIDLTIADSALAQLDRQLRSLFCSTPVVQSIKRSTDASDTPLLTLSIHITPAPTCPAPTVHTDGLL